MSVENRGRIAVVTVHGTGDTAPTPDGQKWFQRGAAFTEQLKAGLAAKGIEADIHPHLWSGANSARAREEGADKLADAIKRLTRTYGGQVHVVGHSHGGNVANEAADLLRWGRRKKGDRIASMTTVGTPFFRSSMGALSSASGFAFLALTALIGIPFAIALIVLLYVYVTEPNVRADLGSDAWLVWTILGVGLTSLIVMARLAIQGARRILRPRAIETSKRSIHAIWHPNDEAIAFLQKVEGAPIEPFPRWSVLRNSRVAGITWGARFVTLASLISIWLLLPQNGGHSILGKLIGETDPAGEANLFALLFTFVLLPGVFAVMYVVVRLLFGLIPEIAFREPANRLVGEIIKGMAFGRDGDERLDAVSTVSHTHQTDSVRLDGPLADRLQANAAGAATQLIEKHRWSLFSVGEDATDALSRLATDAMTWDSLIHTTYFDHPEIVDLIVAYIAAAVDPDAAESKAGAPASPERAA